MKRASGVIHKNKKAPVSACFVMACFVLKKNDMTKFQIQKTGTRLSLSFPSTMKNIDVADAEVKAFLTKAGLESRIFGICLCMREAMTNSVRHGHNNDPSKTVRMNLEIKKTTIEMDIGDEGNGFDWKRAGNRPDRTCPDSGRGSENGRGLSIINAYSSEFRYNEKGNVIFIRYDI